MSDPYFHYKGSVTLENDTHRYVVQGFELWEEREVITVQFEERPWTEYHVPGVSSWHGVATLSGALPGLLAMAYEEDGIVRVILSDGRAGRAYLTDSDDDTITLTGVGEPPS